jgi:hypothetical protein
MQATALFELRRRNLNLYVQHLIDSGQFKNGQQIAAHFDIALTTLSGLLNSQRPIAEKTARELELKLSLNAYSLDQDNELALLQPQKSRFYTMCPIQHQLFKLDKGSVHCIADSYLKLKATSYFIEVIGQCYHPVFLSGCYLLLDEKTEPQASDYVLLRLKDELCLVGLFLGLDNAVLTIQSLDYVRQVKFDEQDIVAIHTLIAVLPRSQIKFDE